MDAKHWQQIEDLFHATMALDASERPHYLHQACSENESLQKEVESLISALESSDGLMAQPAFELGIKVLRGNQADSIVGTVGGAYKIIKLLGRGGMGEVYLAEDTRLGRKVALKFLSPEFVGDHWAKRQLIKEAQAVAMLDHPNICPVYGIEEHEGYSFIVMQYVEGETLADIIHTQAFSADRVLPLAQQIVGALAEAHAHGIIHRDIKPRNIVVTSSGKARVLDFGLAKTIQQKQSSETAADSVSHLSQSGLVPGTIAYMSPEQLRAEKLDYRSDIFSLGTVLYEMVTGKNPYAHDNNAEIISAVLTIKPASFKQTSAQTSRELDRIVQKCLEKKKEDRYQSASELLYDLNNSQQAAGKANHWQRLFNLQSAVAVALLLILAGASWFSYHRWGRARTMAVLPIINESGDHRFDYLEDGLAESLIIKLTRLSQLKVMAFSSVMAYRGRALDSQSIGRALGADTVLVEKIVRENQATLLRVDLIETANGSEIWGEQYDINTNAISDLRENISQKVAAALKLPLGVNEKKALSSRDTQSEEAFLEYLRGIHYWNNRNKENIQRAVDRFKAAIDLDPAFARAHAGLADCYALMNTPSYGDMSTEEAMGMAKTEAKMALLIDDTLADAHTSLGLVNLKYDWKWQEAENEFKEAIRLDPDYAPAHYWYSNLLTITLRYEEALRESSLARQLDTSSPSMRANFCRQFYYGRQYEKAASCAKDMLKDEPESVSAKYLLGYVYVRQGMADKAVEVFKGLPENNKALKLVAVGYAYCQAGRKPECLKAFSDVQEMMSREPNLPPNEMAVMYLGLGDGNNALDWLEKAYQQRAASLIYLSVEPGYDSLHSDPRFVDLTRRLNLPPPPLTASSPGQ